ncbi:MAG TPA: hypothetical protein VNS58_08120 [Puia sp.]|nr:hypothetical protein [Puia sp.]
MQKVRILLGAILVILISSCSKDNDPPAPAPTDLVGQWNLTEVYGKDFRGAPLYWRSTSADTKINFTADKKYYRKYSFDTAYTFIGTYEKLSDSTVKITVANPPNPTSPSYILRFFFEKGELLNIGHDGFEGVTRERFKLSPS